MQKLQDLLKAQRHQHLYRAMQAWLPLLERSRELRGCCAKTIREECNAAGQGGWENQLSPRNQGIHECEEFRELPPARRLNHVRECVLCRLFLSCCDPEDEREKFRWRNWIRDELCQEQNKCSQSHYQLLHVDAEPPDRRRSPVCDHARKGKDVPAARKRRITTSGMRACTSEVAVMQKRSRYSEQIQGREPGHVTCTAELRTGGWSCQTATPMERGLLSHGSHHGQTGCQATHRFLSRRDPGTRDPARS
jgi:hypothetical protein